MKQTKIYLTSFFILCVFAVAVTGCKKEKTIDYNSPAYKIAESEKLIIPAAVSLPENLPNGNSRVATFYAEGVQKYKAQAKAGSFPVTYEWVFVAPQADLYDASNRKVGTHGAGPFWEFSQTDSIYGQHFMPAKTAPATDANSIDWLMLMPKDGKTANGIFYPVTHIQRIATTGGKAPAILPLNASETTEVKYTAIYRFVRKNP